MIGCGNFVAAMSKMTLCDRHMAVIDLFRVADGRIVEHWDVTEEITPRETWVNSGKLSLASETRYRPAASTA